MSTFVRRERTLQFCLGRSKSVLGTGRMAPNIPPGCQDLLQVSKYGNPVAVDEIGKMIDRECQDVQEETRTATGMRQPGQLYDVELKKPREPVQWGLFAHRVT
ncbi:hypothetical protein FRC03_011990 [Tulasnella sp. 419]|nr:hypothetical protein FRC03_011990 [Tulasnella sp. 419]